MLLFAVQVGPTYGGGFRICPDADPADGRFDVCIARPPMGFLRTALMLLSSKEGGHLRLAKRSLVLARPQRLHLEFDCPPPVQIDGELIESSTFDIRTDPQALTVLFARERARL